MQVDVYTIGVHMSIILMIVLLIEPTIKIAEVKPVNPGRAELESPFKIDSLLSKQPFHRAGIGAGGDNRAFPQIRDFTASPSDR